MEFYHLSRNGVINNVIDKQVISDSELSSRYRFKDEDCFHTDNELLKELHKINKNGITNHGKQYLIKNSAYIRMQEGLFLDISWTIEMVWELIRKAYYPEINSRFSSIFAFSTINDIKQFIQGRGDVSQAKIYKVEAQNYFKGDMNLLKIPNLGLGLEVVAKKYWESMPSCNPFWEYLLYPPIHVINEIIM